ncbi:LuxR C-terminal-related transcriptional regulator [Sphingomonas cavernae]|nr:LuxR C-terminal-related transcriptional regulator [Sphingomonas cavernae]
MKERVALLTEPQREALRLVFAHKNSKEIALALGLSPFSVDKRIERSIRTLGVHTRIEAARLLAEYETDAAYEHFVCESEGLAGDGEEAMLTPSQPMECVDESRVRDSAAPPVYRTGELDRTSQWTWPGRLRSDSGRQRNDLTNVERLMWIGGSALALVFALFLALAVTESLQRTLLGMVSRTN